MSEILGAGPLTWITFLPILGMVIIILIPSGKDDISKATSIQLFRWGTVFFYILAINTCNMDIYEFR